MASAQIEVLSKPHVTEGHQVIVGAGVAMPLRH
jgi:hypothetical protein